MYCKHCGREIADDSKFFEVMKRKSKRIQGPHHCEPCMFTNLNQKQCNMKKLTYES